jgi:hypothetical protein
MKVDNTLGIAGEQRGDRSEVLTVCLGERDDVLPTPNRAGLPKAALGTKFVTVEAVRRRLPEAMLERLLMDNSRYP